LIIGEYHFSTKETVGFVASNEARDVLAALDYEAFLGGKYCAPLALKAE